MLGAIIGDIVGSIYERHNIKSKEFPWWGEGCHPTDDSVLTLAVARSILDCLGEVEDLEESCVQRLREFGRRYPLAGYGSGFRAWLLSATPEPYYSYGNGAAMRVSACAWAAATLEEVRALSHAVTTVTHNSPEGLMGAEATAVTIFLARQHLDKQYIRRYVEEHYYGLDFTVEELRPTYEFDATCNGTVPQAIVCFLESTSFEDAVRNAISLGGDSDTLGAITGSIAEAYYGVPEELAQKALSYLDAYQGEVLKDWEIFFPTAKK